MDVHDELIGLLLHHGPSPEVASFIAQERDRLDLRSILEETFRRVDLGPRDLVCRQGACVSPEVEFLLRQGARFEYESRNVHKLLEDTYLYIDLGPPQFKRRTESCLSPEVEFLFTQGASFERVPCGLSQLVEATTEYLQRNNQNKNYFLFQQAMHNRLHPRWHSFLGKVCKSLLKYVDSGTLCDIVHLISRQHREFKIHTSPSEAQGILWPYGVNTKNYIMDASIIELKGSSDIVTIRVRGREITALKALLQARSPYFKKLISDNSENGSFEIKGSYKSVDLAVMFAYLPYTNPRIWDRFKTCDSRDTNEDTLDELINILHAANMLEMPDMFGSVEQYIVIHGKSFIHVKNVQELKVIAREANAGNLERYCNAFIATNLRTFTLFLDLPAELRMNIWRQIASQPRILTPSTMKGLKMEISPHIAVLSRVCKESASEMQRVWGEPSIDGINFEFDIIWLDPYFPSSSSLEYSLAARNARYCATPAPYPALDSAWEYRIAEKINSCPCLKVLYLIATALTDGDEFEYCRGFTNREPTMLVEARKWIEESAHQRLRKKLPNDFILPEIVLIDEHAVRRLAG